MNYRILVTALLTALLLCTLIPHRVEAQTKPTKAERRAAAEAFNTTYGQDWVVRWNDQRGTPQSIFGHQLTQYSGTPEEIARAFFSDQRQMFGIKDVAQDLRLEKTHESRHGTIGLFFRQYYEGLPVLNGGYLVVIGMEPEGLMISVQRGTPIPDELSFDSAEEYQWNVPDFSRSSDGWYIDFVNGDYFPDIKVSTNTMLTVESVRALAQQTVPNLASISDPQLAVFVDERETNLEYLLVYDVEGVLNSEELWYALIDAHSGAIFSQHGDGGGVAHTNQFVVVDAAQISKTSHQLTPIGEGDQGLLESVQPRRATTIGYGKVYETNQEHETSTTTKTLSRLTYNGNKADVRLDGTWIKVVRGDGASVAEPTSTSPVIEFFFTDTNDHFDEVMAYHHANEFRYWVYYMGMPWSHVSKTTITVAYQSSDPNDFARAPTSSTLRFMDGFPSRGWLNPTHEGAIIAHEFAHLVTRAYNSKFSTVPPQAPPDTPAMWEAYSDYFGIAWRHEQGCASSDPDECSVVGIYADPDGNAEFKRDIDAGFNYNTDWNSDNDGNGVYPTAYDRSLILSGALWAFREQEGWIADYIVQKSISNLASETSLDFTDARDAVYEAADDSYYIAPFTYYTCTTCQSTVNSVFSARGIPAGGAKRGADAPEDTFTESPHMYRLHSNYPNPFNPVTVIRFDVSADTQVSLVVYDLLGREVIRLVEGFKKAGAHSVVWDASLFPSGTYFYELVTDMGVQTRHMLLLK